MSQWVHVCGCLQLSASAFSISNKKGKTLAKKVLVYKDKGERFAYELKKQTANWDNLESRF